MINFRYHVVSLIAVFLALGIGIIMGTAVIDRAVVDRLERQQTSLQADVDEVQAENNRLRTELREERDAARQLADEGSERLLDGTLAGEPVLVIGSQGIDADGLEQLVTLLGRADAAYQGTLWLTDRFVLDDESERRDLAEALSFRPDATVGTLRSAAITRLARALRPVVGTPTEETPVIPALIDAGFLDFEPAEGAPAETFPTLDPATRFVVGSGPDAAVEDRLLTLPLVRALVAPRSGQGPVGVVVVSGAPALTDGDDTFIGPTRRDELLAGRLSTVDDIDDFAGRAAAVLALVDLEAGRFGHYGRGPGAQRLLPAPAE